MTGKLTGLKDEPAAVLFLTGCCILSFKLSLMKSSVTSDLIFILDIPEKQFWIPIFNICRMVL